MKKVEKQNLVVKQLFVRKLNQKMLREQQLIIFTQAQLVKMSFGVYRYEHSEFGPIMLLLDSEPEKPQTTLIKQENNRYNTRHIEETIEYQKKAIDRKRGRSNISYYNTDKSTERQKPRGSQQKVKKGGIDKLPIIPNSNKKKIQL